MVRRIYVQRRGGVSRGAALGSELPSISDVNLTPTTCNPQTPTPNPNSSVTDEYLQSSPENASPHLSPMMSHCCQKFAVLLYHGRVFFRFSRPRNTSFNITRHRPFPAIQNCCDVNGIHGSEGALRWKIMGGGEMVAKMPDSLSRKFPCH